MKDYSEYLKKPAMLAFIETEWLKHKHIHEAQAAIVNKVLREQKISCVFEVGCGTGNVAPLLECDPDMYMGFDSNEDCVRLALEKNKRYIFSVLDVRDIKESVEADTSMLVFCFGFLKHFSLDEWENIFKKVSSLGDYFIFNMPVGETKDDGTEFHHVWMSLSEIKENIKKVGFELLEIVNDYPLEPGFICKRVKL